MSCVEPCIIVHGGAGDIFRLFDTKQINQDILGVQEAAKVGYQILLKVSEQQWFIYLYQSKQRSRCKLAPFSTMYVQ